MRPQVFKPNTWTLTHLHTQENLICHISRLKGKEWREWTQWFVLCLFLQVSTLTNIHQDTPTMSTPSQTTLQLICTHICGIGKSSTKPAFLEEGSSLATTYFHHWVWMDWWHTPTFLSHLISSRKESMSGLRQQGLQELVTLPLTAFIMEVPNIGSCLHQWGNIGHWPKFVGGVGGPLANTCVRHFYARWMFMLLLIAWYIN